MFSKVVHIELLSDTLDSRAVGSRAMVTQLSIMTIVINLSNHECVTTLSIHLLIPSLADRVHLPQPITSALSISQFYCFSLAS
jgi:hypothetical protein